MSVITARRGRNPSRVDEPEYAAPMQVRRVMDGRIRWRRQRVFVGKGLNGERVGVEEIEEGVWRVLVFLL